MTAERLSVLDASFLTLETDATPLQTGSLGLFEPGLDFADVLDALRARLHLVPLARKRLQRVPLGGQPVWVDDTDFDLTYHVRHAALPAPGDRGQLGEFIARLASRPLDRRRPLWEFYIIEGLAGGRTGLFRKVHLAVAGGHASDLFSALLDDRPDAPDPDPPPERWHPIEPPGRGVLAADVVGERLAQLVDAGQTLRRVAATPARLAGAATRIGASTLGLAARLVRSPPVSPLNTRLSPHRRFATARADLERLRAIRRAFGGAINDVVVTVVADAVGRLLRARGHDTTDLDLQVMVPVRVSGTPGAEVAEADRLGHGAVGVLAPLPVMGMDPVARLYRVMGELAGIRESRQAVAADALVRLAGYAPPNLHALAARVASAEQRYNLALSNAPGPQTPRYLRGVRMEETYPFVPLAGDAALSVAVTSYAGAAFFGLLGDRAATPDLELLAHAITEAVAELAAAADAEQRRARS